MFRWHCIVGLIALKYIGKVILFSVYRDKFKVINL